MITAESVVRRVGDCLERDLGHAMILWRVEADEFFVLEATGYLIYGALRGGSAGVSKIVEVLHAQHPGTPREILTDDICEFVGQLVSLGVVSVGAEAA